MLLSAVEMGRQFTIGDVRYAHDPNGKNGGGMVGVRNLRTNELEMIVATTEVKLVDVEVNEPVVLDPPHAEETYEPFNLEIPLAVELVEKEDENEEGKE